MAAKRKSIRGQRARTPKGRVTHIIRPNERCFTPTVRVYFDTEAHRRKLAPKIEQQTLWFGWALYERVIDKESGVCSEPEWIRFTDGADFFIWLEAHTRDKSATYIYAHNLGYDAAMIALETNAAGFGWDVEEYVPGNHLLWVSLRKGTKSLIFIDTLNYFQSSLAVLGERIGYGKGEMPKDTTDSETWDTYCKRDVSVLQSAMHTYFELISSQDLGAYRKTAASQAYGAWRHRFMQYPVLVVADPVLEQFERSAYHGGRSEVFYDTRRTGPIYELDVNSMYMYAMLDDTIPTRKASSGDACDGEQLSYQLSRGTVIADVTVSTDEPCFPYNTGNRIIYPIGTFRTVLSGPELRYAVIRQSIRHIHHYTLYEAKPLFTDYIHTMYGLRLSYRESGNEAFSYLCKLLGNSLYGKFGQRGYQWKQCPYDGPDNISEWFAQCGDNQRVLSHRTRFGHIWHRLDNAESFESFPAIAAHITAYARMYLWQLITIAGREHVFYVDTDSIWTDETGYERLGGWIHKTELGKLKLERVHDWAYFRAPKDYETNLTEKIKGVRSKARRVSGVTYEQEQFESYDAALSRGFDGEIIVKTIQKTVTRRNLQSSGNGQGWRSPIQLSGDVTL